ncbi:DNA polymerase III subunit delta [Paenibacillus sp. YN15]|uniref:DNA polymerase III subunit delta n=1 Tax=Paenibacillus sp. YN15 TaxID=1742774 RepID=UPI000DCE208C|nr:DNA polymerase III subunit delta [Paenibacillus sp. YN15]RAU94181.1 DNA polymerase III subunit delta [Paenibacillus sp. YN15]
MDARTWIKELDKGTVRPLYICYGPEKYRMREFIDYVLRKCVPEDVREFAVTKYDLTETSLDDVLEDAQTMPFMAERKVILASNAAFLTGAKENAKVEHRPEKLLDYMKAPVDFSVLILTVDADKLDERKKIVKLLKDNGSMAPFVPLSADDLLQWVKRQAEALSFRFAAGAAEALLLSAGTDLQALRSELEKLSLYAGSGGTVSVEDVDGMVARTTEQDVFMLIDHIVRLRKEKAMTVFHELLLKKEEPIKIAALMTRQFRMLLQVKELERQGYSQQQMASQLGGHPYGIKIASEQSRRFSFEQLASILSSLAELDYGMKTGKVEKTLGMELFILKLAV